MTEGAHAELPAAAVVAVVDDACFAEPILAWTQREANRLGREATVMYAPALDALGNHASTRTHADHDCETVQAVAARLAGRAPPLPVVARPDTPLGELRRELLTAAPYLIVTGRSAPSVLAELLFGPRGGEPPGPPVVIVPPHDLRPGCQSARHPVLTVGFHPSAAAAAALRWAVGEAKQIDGRVRTVAVWYEDQPASLAGAVRVSSHRNALPGRAATTICGAALASTGAPLDLVTSVVVRGGPARALLREAASGDLLVIGASPATVHHHPILGPTAATCAADTVVPLAIVTTSQCEFGSDEPTR